MFQPFVDGFFQHYGWAGLIGLATLAALAGFVAYSWWQERGGRGPERRASPHRPIRSPLPAWIP